jgi:CubicO group peptidase (beta-lactamase class C family)
MGFFNIVLLALVQTGLRNATTSRSYAVLPLHRSPANTQSSDLGNFVQNAIEKYVAGNTGNVGAIAMTSKGEFGISRAPGASVSIVNNTVFEVGSTTKVVTTLAAEIFAGRGKLSMGSPISKYLPVSVKLSPAVANITLLQLATHTSGLARMPSNAPNTPDPMHAYTPDMLYTYLSNLTKVGEKKFLYSNTGFGVLGLILTIVSDTAWETLVAELILKPLGLDDTSVTLSTSQQQRLAPPTSLGKPAPMTTFTDAMVGAGGLRSTAADLLAFTEAFAGFTPVSEEMRAAMDRMMVPYAPDEMGNYDGHVAEALQIYTMHLAPILWKDGSTSGYNCYMAFDNETAVVALANNAVASEETYVGITAQTILGGPPVPREEFPNFPPALLDEYLGNYSMRANPFPAAQFLVSRGKTIPQLVLHSPLADAVLYPFSETAFFSRDVAGLEVYFDARRGHIRVYSQGVDYEARSGP